MLSITQSDVLNQKISSTSPKWCLTEVAPPQNAININEVVPPQKCHHHHRSSSSIQKGHQHHLLSSIKK
ncbi:hypothetical protein CEXT_600841 [Caerostris extrusa]|uniref:Uncharacterized protein n=1 Tax=Caerostris extrusa TaxID=172846 RepID=A0AAV4Y6E2_CAEEX|nr:hypothetical protein CEXT_600841 [Caerostris extrusa]